LTKISKIKRRAIIEARQAGELKRLSNNSFTVPSRFFVLGITPGMVAEVLKEA